MRPRGPRSPSGPGIPGGPAGPRSPGGPDAPGAPVGPTAPGAPTLPVAPLGPVGPAAPGEPGGPEGPTAPGTPASPGTPAGPVGPRVPRRPRAPTGPRSPCGPCSPCAPVSPGGPCGPGAPGGPEGPGTPTPSLPSGGCPSTVVVVVAPRRGTVATVGTVGSVSPVFLAHEFSEPDAMPTPITAQITPMVAAPCLGVIGGTGRRFLRCRPLGRGRHDVILQRLRSAAALPGDVPDECTDDGGEDVGEGADRVAVVPFRVQRLDERSERGVEDEHHRRDGDEREHHELGHVADRGLGERHGLPAHVVGGCACCCWAYASFSNGSNGTTLGRTNISCTSAKAAVVMPTMMPPTFSL